MLDNVNFFGRYKELVTHVKDKQIAKCVDKGIQSVEKLKRVQAVNTAFRL